MRTKLTVLALFALTVGLAGCKSSEERAKDEAAKKAELDKFQGKWTVASREGDKDEDADEVDEKKAGYYYIVEGDIIRDAYVDKDGKEDVFTRQKLTNLGGGDPKQVDLVYVDDKGKPITTRTTKKGVTGKRKTTTSELKNVAIYKFDGDTLTLTISFDEKKRPTDFTAPAKSSRYTLKLQKVKDGAKPEETKVPTPATPK